MGGRQRDGQGEDRGGDADDQAGQDVAALGRDDVPVVGQRRGGREEVVVRAQQLGVVLERADDDRVDREQQDRQRDQRGDSGQPRREFPLPAHVSPASVNRG